MSCQLMKPYLVFTLNHITAARTLVVISFLCPEVEGLGSVGSCFGSNLDLSLVTQGGSAGSQCRQQHLWLTTECLDHSASGSGVYRGSALCSCS